MGWFLTRDNFQTDEQMVQDWKRFPELWFLNRFDWIPVVLFAIAIFVTGHVAGVLFPGAGTSGWQAFFWGFVLSTIVLYHATYTINSVAHRLGKQRFATADDSRNNWFLALITLGEGWHNNHHHYPASARQGFFWWEIDLTWYVLLLFEKLGLIWDLRPVPKHALERDLVAPVQPEAAA